MKMNPLFSYDWCLVAEASDQRTSIEETPHVEEPYTPSSCRFFFIGFNAAEFLAFYEEGKPCLFLIDRDISKPCRFAREVGGLQTITGHRKVTNAQKPICCRNGEAVFFWIGMFTLK